MTEYAVNWLVKTHWLKVSELCLRQWDRHTIVWFVCFANSNKLCINFYNKLVKLNWMKQTQVQSK